MNMTNPSIAMNTRITKPYIFFKDGKLFACEMDDLIVTISPSINTGAKEPSTQEAIIAMAKAFQKKEAIARALPVSNPELFLDQGIIIVGLYQWPGTLEKAEVLAYPIDHTSYPPYEHQYKLKV